MIAHLWLLVAVHHCRLSLFLSYVASDDVDPQAAAIFNPTLEDNR